jgi:hypothetical protein
MRLCHVARLALDGVPQDAHLDTFGPCHIRGGGKGLRRGGVDHVITRERRGSSGGTTWLGPFSTAMTELGASMP